MQISIAGKDIATYVYNDPQILRPYLMHLHAPNGLQVTRNQPPQPGKDIDDHPTFHPGLWLAFGDLSGGDFWRNRVAVRHLQFIEPPHGGSNHGAFAVKNRYEKEGVSVCDEVCHLSLRVVPAGYLLTYDSTFTAANDFYFGDQEEMGLGIRVATPLAVKRGGRIVNSDGRQNEAQVWGQQADWCSYEGTIDGQTVGIAILPDPANFRRSWFHARDYGLLVANPFGALAFTKGEPSRQSVKAGESFRIRFGILLYGDGTSRPIDLEAAYRDFTARQD